MENAITLRSGRHVAEYKRDGYTDAVLVEAPDEAMTNAEWHEYCDVLRNRIRTLIPKSESDAREMLRRAANYIHANQLGSPDRVAAMDVLDHLRADRSKWGMFD